MTPEEEIMLMALGTFLMPFGILFATWMLDKEKDDE